MPAPRYRSRTFRRVFKKVASGVVLHYRRRKPGKAKCTCGAMLHGVPRELPYKMASMPKTKKKPERPYGGVLCSKCMRNEIINKIRQKIPT